MATAPPQSTGKTRARRVFGDIVTEEVDSSTAGTSSLTYSPSPVCNRKSPQGDSQLGNPAPKIITFQDGTKPATHTQFFPDKENLENEGKSHQSAEDTKRGESSSVSDLSKRKQVELQRLRNQSKSPLRRDLVKRTQEAINNATSSVNQSLNAVRRAKAEKYQERATETAKLRDQWRDEKLDAQHFYAQAEKSRQELLALQRQLSSKFAKAKAQREIDERNAQLEAISRETHFKSEVYRKHKQSLKEEMDRKRRHSVEARRKIRRNNLEGEQKMRLMRIEEDQALMEERHLSSVAWRETKKELADKTEEEFRLSKR